MPKRGRVLIVLLLVVAIMTGCAQTPNQSAAEPTVAPSDTAVLQPTAESATATVLPAASPTAAASATLPTAVPATLTPAPATPTAAPAAPVVQPVAFPAGVSTLAVQSELPAGGADTYSLRIQAGQMLLLNAPNQQGQAALGVRGADGGVLLSEQAGVSVWNGEITATQDYYVTVKSLAGAPLSYMLQITIPPLPQPPTPQPPTPQPAQVQQVIFPAGAASIVLQGAPVPQASDRYVLRALASQSMTINLPAQQGNLIVNIWGADGAPLLSEAAVANWTGTLPKTQDYFIDIRNIGANKIAYLLTVMIPPLPATPELEPRRITFAAGAEGAAVYGTLAAQSSERWVLRVRAGQTINALATASQGVVGLSIWGADGTVLLSDHSDATSFSVVAPITQDYTIRVRAAPGGPAVYMLKVQIPAL